MRMGLADRIDRPAAPACLLIFRGIGFSEFLLLTTHGVRKDKVAAGINPAAMPRQCSRIPASQR
jgi:hypothetical protein